MSMVEWNMNHLLFANGTTLVVDSEERLKHLGEEFGRMCKKRKLSE